MAAAFLSSALHLPPEASTAKTTDFATLSRCGMRLLTSAVCCKNSNKENNKTILLFSFSEQIVSEIKLLLCFEYIINLFIFSYVSLIYFIFEAIIPPEMPPTRLIGIIRSAWNVMLNLLIISNNRISIRDIENPFIIPTKNPFILVFFAG